jgi:hypothetical protein
MERRVIGLDAAIEALGRTYEAVAFPGDECDRAGPEALAAFHERLRTRLLSELPLPTPEEVRALRVDAPGGKGAPPRSLQAA